MKKAEIDKLLAKLLGLYEIYAPRRKGDDIVVGKICDNGEVDWSGELPKNTFKSIFLPVREELAEFQGGNLKSVIVNQKSQIAWGVNILDIQAFSLFEQVFAKDIYYQTRRQNTFVVGFTNGLPEDYRRYKAEHLKYEENILEHVIFDVFIERKKNGEFMFFSGSTKGQKLLEDNGIKDYEHIEFVGLVQEQGPNPIIRIRKDLFKNNLNNETWEQMADSCLACGKCTVVCPTCFCFDQKDEPTIEGVKKIRQWASCFYPEFSKVAGGGKDLDSLKKRLQYWYEHKFSRIPEEFGYYGCVNCGRCGKNCPVGIGVAKTFQSLQKEKKSRKV